MGFIGLRDQGFGMRVARVTGLGDLCISVLFRDTMVPTKPYWV